MIGVRQRLRLAPRVLGLTILAVHALGGAVGAQEDAQAVRVNGAGPVIDGRIDESAWLVAPPLTGLRQR